MKRSLFLLLSAFVFLSCEYETEKIDLKPKEIPEVTLMIYMAADNDLESYALENIKAMERADLDNIRVLVLLDRADGYDESNGNWTDTRLFEIVHDSSDSSLIKSTQLDCPKLGLSVTENTELDMSNPSVLRNFIEFGKGSYESKLYSLIIWGHGTGWQAFAIDDRTDSYMTVSQLGEALREEDISVIGFDTCFGGVLENVYELESCAQYIVASPGITPGTGWDYQKLLQTLSDQAATSKNISSENITESMTSSFSGLTVFKTEKLESLFSAFENFSKALAGSITDSITQSEVLNSLVNCKSYCYTQSPCELYLDIYSLAELYSSSSDTRLSDSAENLRNAINDSCVSKFNRNGAVGVYFIPKTASGALAPVHSADYLKDENRTDQISFIKKSSWWVPTKARRSSSVLDKLFYTSF